MLGFSYDWGRELATTDVDYFRWTQWIFLQIYDTWFDPERQKGRPIAELPIPQSVRDQGQAAICRYQDEHRLAYQTEAPVNWCPALGTVLANEEVVDGKSERGGHPVVRTPLRQWMLRITAYADRLEKDLDSLDWPESVKALQRNWIGRSTGAEVDFFIGSDSDRQEGKPASEAFETWKQARAEQDFPSSPDEDVLRIYTTRPDTLFGATYMVIAPEHPFVERLTTDDRMAAVTKYCEEASTKSDLDRTDLAKKKTGEFTGSYAINPVNGEAIPIWVADYVLISYGTGAIMAVPAHDERDFEFAQQFDIPIRCVVAPPSVKHTGFKGISREELEVQARSSDHEWAEKRKNIFEGRAVFAGAGTAVNSGEYDGQSTDEFKKNITADLAKAGLGRGAVNYKLRDWLFSRQRFWGEPFPLLHELDADGKPTGRVRAVPESELPVDLPHLDDFKPHGRPEPPLAKAPDEWLHPVIDGAKYRRETNTMPQWAGSCWYYLRFLDPKNDRAMIDPEVEKAWMPVDLYIGGAEHAVLHLLYSRFWHKVLFDRGVVSTKEPFQKLVNQGMILGEAELTGYVRRDFAEANATGEGVVRVHLRKEKDLETKYVRTEDFVSTSDVELDAEGKPQRKSPREEVIAVQVDDEVAKKGESFVLAADENIRVDSRAFKMSKSRGNVINPDDVVREYGADALRLYEMFMGPLTATKPWSMEGVNGVRGFLDRAWRMIVDDRAELLKLNEAVQDTQPDDDQNRMLHATIGAVTDDIAALSFNTAIARMMEFTNFFTKQRVRPKSVMQQFVLLLSPFAPHLAEELWQLLGHSETLAYEPWPEFDAEAAKEDTIEVPVQIKGKVRSRISVAADATKQQLEEAARADEKVAELIAGKDLVKVIVVPGRLVNFVTK